LKVASLAPGTEVKFNVLRKGNETDVPVKLGEMPADKNEKLGENSGQGSVTAFPVLQSRRRSVFCSQKTLRSRLCTQLIPRRIDFRRKHQ
jgi:hypothetical protein